MADLSRNGGDPTMKMKNTRGSTRGNTRESLKPTRIDHTCARSMNTKGDTRSKVNNGRYKM